MTSVSPQSATPTELPPASDRNAPTVVAGKNAWRNDERRYSALGQLVLTRVREFYRRPTAIFWVYVFPILMAIVLGVAFSNPNVDEVKAGIVSDIHPALAQRIAAGLANQQGRAATGSAKIDAVLVSDLEGRRGLRLGRFTLLVVPRPTDAAAAGASTTATDTTLSGQLADVNVEYLYDPGAPESYAGRWAVDDALQRAAGRREPLATNDARFEEPGSRYIDFVIPGLIGASLMSSGLWGVGFVIVDMRVRNLLKRFFTTPMRRTDFLAGMIFSRMFFIVTEVLLLLAVSRWLFDVRVLGSWLAVLFLIVLGSGTFAAIGLLMASRARTVETASGMINLVMMPMWMVSGIFFSADRFPAATQPLIKALPLTAVINALRGVMIEELSLFALWGPVTVLLIWGIASFAVSLRLFRWQ
ncbi:MAG: ABC transporter permease [Pirellulales bacterium]|nr:ABC transporter permease [Pirellulales bacterium]